MTMCFYLGVGLVSLWVCVSSRRQVEWEAASSLIEGICLTLQRQPIISFLPHLRSLINVCVNLVWKHTTTQILLCGYCFLSVCVCVLSGDGCGRSLQCGRWASSSPPQPLPVPSTALQHGGGATGRPADPGEPHLNSPELGSSSASHYVIFTPVVFFLSKALKEDFPLSHVISPFTNQERREGMLLNLLIPFVLTVGSGSKGQLHDCMNVQSSNVSHG